MLLAFGGLQPFMVTLGTFSTYKAIISNGGNPVPNPDPISFVMLRVVLVTLLLQNP